MLADLKNAVVGGWDRAAGGGLLGDARPGLGGGARPSPAATTKASASPSAGTPTVARPTPGAVLRGRYVALGDSYTAGLGVPRQTGAVAGCGQSTSGYPRLVARALRLDLTDMSCSSATIADMTTAQPTGQGTNPAQLSALSSGDALVTVGIGGNDIGLIDIVTKCTELDLVPALIPGQSSTVTPCESYYTSGGTDQIRQRVDAIRGSLADLLRRISERAPHARVYVVGYPDLLPAGGGGGRCGGALGITAGDVAFLDKQEMRLNGVLAQVARAAGDGYVDTYTPSQGHDACAGTASRWLEPLMPSAAAAPLHPNAAGERAMADAVVEAVGSTS